MVTSDDSDSDSPKIGSSPIYQSWIGHHYVKGLISYHPIGTQDSDSEDLDTDSEDLDLDSEDFDIEDSTTPLQYTHAA